MQGFCAELRHAGQDAGVSRRLIDLVQPRRLTIGVQSIRNTAEMMRRLEKTPEIKHLARVRIGPNGRWCPSPEDNSSFTPRFTHAVTGLGLQLLN